MERGAASDAGRAPRCDKEDGLPRRGTRSGWNYRPGLGRVNDYLGSPPVTPVHHMPEGGCLPPDMANGKTGPAEERGTPVGLAVRVQIGVPSGRDRQAVLRASVRENQDQLRDIRQGFNESIQSYIICFRMLYNKLQHSITNEYPDEITRRAMSDRILKDSLTDFIRGLKTEIGQVLLGNPPHNVLKPRNVPPKSKDIFVKAERASNRPFASMIDYKPRPVTKYVHTTQVDLIYLRSAMKNYVSRIRTRSIGRARSTTLLQIQPWAHVKLVFKFSNTRPATTSTFNQQHRDGNSRIRINATT